MIAHARSANVGTNDNSQTAGDNTDVDAKDCSQSTVLLGS